MTYSKIYDIDADDSVPSVTSGLTPTEKIQTSYDIDADATVPSSITYDIDADDSVVPSVTEEGSYYPKARGYSFPAYDIDEDDSVLGETVTDEIAPRPDYKAKAEVSGGFNVVKAAAVLDKPRAALAASLIASLEGKDLTDVEQQFLDTWAGEDHPVMGDYYNRKMLDIKQHPELYPNLNPFLTGAEVVLEAVPKTGEIVERLSEKTQDFFTVLNACGQYPTKECLDKLVQPIAQERAGEMHLRIEEARRNSNDISGMLKFMGHTVGFVTDVVIDPLTYTNPILSFVNKGKNLAMSSKAVQKIAEQTGMTVKQVKHAFTHSKYGQPLTQLADEAWTLFNTKHKLDKIKIGDKTAWDYQSAFKNLVAAARIKAIRDNTSLQKAIEAYATKTNTPVDDINMFITEAVERGGIRNVDFRYLPEDSVKALSESNELRNIVNDLQLKNEKQLADELDAGVKITKLEDAPLITSDGNTDLYLQYMNHAILPEARDIVLKNADEAAPLFIQKAGEAKGNIFTSKHSSTYKRKEDWAGLTLTDINLLARAGDLPGFEGQIFANGFFHTDPAILQAIRDNKHYRTLAAMELAEGIKGIGISGDDIIKAANDAGWIPKNKKAGKDATVALNYLKKKDAKWGNYTMTHNEYTGGVAFPSEVAKFVDNSLTHLHDPKKIAVFRQGWEAMTRWYKAWTLSIFPSYHTRNAVGNMWNNYVSDVSFKSYKDALHIQQAIAKGHSGTFKLKNGKEVTYKQLRDWADENGVTGRGIFSIDIETSLTNELGKAKWATLSSENKAIAIGKRTGEHIEDNARMANFIDGLNKGMTPEQAGKRVRHTLFDYGDLTEFEQGVMKNLMPFYTWSRKNIPFQIENMIKQPGKYKAIDTAQREIEASVEEADPNEKLLAKWMLINMPTKVKLDEEGKPQYFILGGWLPAADVWKLAAAPASVPTDLLHPVVASFIESNLRPTYTKNVNDPTGFITLFGDRQIKYGEVMNYMGITMDKSTAHYLDKLRVLSTIDDFYQPFNEDRMKSPFAQPKTAEEALVRFFTGIKLHTVDFKTQRNFKFKELEAQIENQKGILKKNLPYPSVKDKDFKEIKNLLDQFKQFNKGGLVTQAERLGFNKGGEASLGIQQRLQDYDNYQDPLLPLTEGEPEKTFTEQMSADYSKRLATKQETEKDVKSGEISSFRGAVNNVGNLAGLGFDAAGNVISSAANTYLDALKSTSPSTYEATAKKVTEAKDWALNTEAGKAAVDAARAGMETYGEWKKENPQDAKTLESVLNIGFASWGAKGISSQMHRLMPKKDKVLEGELLPPETAKYQYKPNSDTPHIDVGSTERYQYLDDATQDNLNKVNKFFNPDVLNKALQGTDKDTKVIYMTPGQFLTLAKTHTSAVETKKLDRVNKAIDEGTQLEDIPTLTMKAVNDTDAKVVKHDGRHRANALEALGLELIPVRVITQDSVDDDKLRAVTNEDNLEVYSYPTSVIYDRTYLGDIDTFNKNKKKAIKQAKENELKTLAEGLVESGGFKYKLPNLLAGEGANYKSGHWKNLLKNWIKKGAVKQEEIDDLRIIEYLDSTQGRVGAKDIFSFMQENSPMLKTYTSKVQTKADTEWLEKQPLWQEKNKLKDEYHNTRYLVDYLTDKQNIKNLTPENTELVKDAADWMHHVFVEDTINVNYQGMVLHNELVDYLTDSPYIQKAIERESLDAKLLNDTDNMHHPDRLKFLENATEAEKREFRKNAVRYFVGRNSPEKRNTFMVSAITSRVAEKIKELDESSNERELLTNYLEILSDGYRAKKEFMLFESDNHREITRLTDEAYERTAGDIVGSPWGSYALPNTKGKPVTILVQSKVGSKDRLQELKDLRSRIKRELKEDYVGSGRPEGQEFSLPALERQLQLQQVDSMPDAEAFNMGTGVSSNASKLKLKLKREINQRKKEFKKDTGVDWNDRLSYINKLEGDIYLEPHYTGIYGESPLKKGIPQENIIMHIRGNIIQQGSFGKGKGLFIGEQQSQAHQKAMASKRHFDDTAERTKGYFKDATGYSEIGSGNKIRELQRKLKASEEEGNRRSSIARNLRDNLDERYDELEDNFRSAILAEAKRDGRELTEGELAREVAVAVEEVSDNTYGKFDPELKNIVSQRAYNTEVISKLNLQESDLAMQIRKLSGSFENSDSQALVSSLRPSNLSHKKDWTPLAMKEAIKYAIDNDLNYIVLPIEKHSMRKIERWGDTEPKVMQAIIDRNSIYSPRAYRNIVKKWDKDAKPFQDEYLDKNKQGDWDENDIHKVIVLPITDAIKEGYKKEGLTAYRRGGLVTQMKALALNE